MNAENNEGENPPEDDALAEINELTENANEGNNKAAANKAASGSGPGRGKRKREVTMPEAVSFRHFYKFLIR